MTCVSTVIHTRDPRSMGNTTKDRQTGQHQNLQTWTGKGSRHQGGRGGPWMGRKYVRITLPNTGFASEIYAGHGFWEAQQQAVWGSTPGVGRPGLHPRVRTPRWVCRAPGVCWASPGKASLLALPPAQAGPAPFLPLPSLVRLVHWATEPLPGWGWGDSGSHGGRVLRGLTGTPLMEALMPDCPWEGGRGLPASLGAGGQGILQGLHGAGVEPGGAMERSPRAASSPPWCAGLHWRRFPPRALGPWG